MARTAALTALSREPVTLPTLGGEVLRLPYPGVIADRFFYLVLDPTVLHIRYSTPRVAHVSTVHELRQLAS